MLLLALDTSTSAVTAALHDGAAVVAAATAVDAQGHGELLAPQLRAVLAEAGARPGDVTDVVTGTGPGPFTGLRVGIVTARVFAHALGIPVHGVGSLDILAHRVWRDARDGRADPPPRLLVATDARRREVYWATYDLDAAGAHRDDGPGVARPADLPPPVATLPTAGRGPLLYPDALPHARGPLDADAADLADLAARRLASGAGLDEPAPRYLRRPDATPAAGVKRVNR